MFDAIVGIMPATPSATLPAVRCAAGILRPAYCCANFCASVSAKENVCFKPLTDSANWSPVMTGLSQSYPSGSFAWNRYESALPTP